MRKYEEALLAPLSMHGLLFFLYTTLFVIVSSSFYFIYLQPNIIFYAKWLYSFILANIYIIDLPPSPWYYFVQWRRYIDSLFVAKYGDVGNLWSFIAQMTVYSSTVLIIYHRFDLFTRLVMNFFNKLDGIVLKLVDLFIIRLARKFVVLQSQIISSPGLFRYYLTLQGRMSKQFYIIKIFASLFPRYFSLVSLIPLYDSYSKCNTALVNLYLENYIVSEVTQKLQPQIKKLVKQLLDYSYTFSVWFENFVKKSYPGLNFFIDGITSKIYIDRQKIKFMFHIPQTISFGQNDDKIARQLYYSRILEDAQRAVFKLLSKATRFNENEIFICQFTTLIYDVYKKKLVTGSAITPIELFAGNNLDVYAQPIKISPWLFDGGCALDALLNNDVKQYQAIYNYTSFIQLEIEVNGPQVNENFLSLDVQKEILKYGYIVKGDPKILEENYILESPFNKFKPILTFTENQHVIEIDTPIRYKRTLKENILFEMETCVDGFTNSSIKILKIKSAKKHPRPALILNMIPQDGKSKTVIEFYELLRQVMKL